MTFNKLILFILFFGEHSYTTTSTHK